MFDYLASSIPVLVVVALTIIIVFGGLVFYALRIKGDVFAELSHGKTSVVSQADRLLLRAV
jgi:hypothetical protein